MTGGNGPMLDSEMTLDKCTFLAFSLVKPSHFKCLSPGNKACQNVVADGNRGLILLVLWADRPGLALSVGSLVWLHLAGRSARPGFCWAGWSRTASLCTGPLSVSSPAGLLTCGWAWLRGAGGARRCCKAPDVWAPEHAQLHFCHMHWSK